MDEARFVLGMMFMAARNRNETVALVRFASDGAPSDPGVEIERTATPSKDLAIAWIERAERAPGTAESVTYAVRLFKDGRSEGTYALPAVVRMPARTPDEEAYQEAVREAKEERDRLGKFASWGYRFGQTLARRKP